MNNKVVLSGVPGISQKEIEVFKKYLLEEFPEVNFVYLSENAIDSDEFVEKCKDADIILSWVQNMTDEMYKKMNLKAFCAPSIGYNAANVKAATKNNVLVTNCAGFCADEVATHAIMFMLNCARKTYVFVEDVKKGNWNLDVGGSIKRFAGSKVGLLGFGNIPRLVAKKLMGFGVEVYAYDPYVSQEKMDEFNVKKAELEEVLKISDYISIHMPLLESTKNIINKETISMMKKGVYFINTARGGLVNHKDLYDALVSRHIEAAGLDVLENEPLKELDYKLIELPNTIVTPHSAFLSDDAVEAMWKISAKAVGDILKGTVPKNVINPEVLDRVDWIKK